LYGAGFLKTVSRELARYKLDLVEYRSNGRAVAPNLRENTLSSTGKGNEKHESGIVFYKIITSAVKKVEFVNDMMSYVILRVLW
jgi:hypothetical protein